LRTRGCAANAIAEILGKDGIVFLHTGGGRQVTAGYGAVDDIEATLSLVQPQLKVRTATPRKVLCSPLNVEDAVGSGATYRCEDAEASVDQIQIVPVREDRVVMGSPRQASISKGRIGGHKLGIAVGRQIDRREGLVVQRVREWQRDGGYCVVPVIADVRGARYDAAPYLSYRV